jgi:hypothetical protein
MFFTNAFNIPSEDETETKIKSIIDSEYAAVDIFGELSEYKPNI